jgi:hypothetical protein
MAGFVTLIGATRSMPHKLRPRRARFAAEFHAVSADSENRPTPVLEDLREELGVG